MVHNLVHEVTVVADYDDASGEVLQILFEHFKRLYVKVVGRLVEYEEVRIAHQYGAQIELAFLSSAQLVHIVMLLFGWEEEVLQ